MKPSWLKKRHYRHFDVPVDEKFAVKAQLPAFVAQHGWSPLIHYIKVIKRYKPLQGKTVLKERPIMYASHRDACILSNYSHKLNALLEGRYATDGLESSVIAYRALGRANYHFAASAKDFAMALSPCVVLCFDITGFFDNLDHSILKSRLKELLPAGTIPDDWHRVFRHVTRYRKVDLTSLVADPVIGPRLKVRGMKPIATIAEIVGLGIAIDKNPAAHGIPQGTPISSTLSNLYMLHVDRCMNEICRKGDALYQRYSDDLIVICKPEVEPEITAALHACIGAHKLEIHPDKYERVIFDASSPASFQYLGFDVSPNGTLIRASSLSRQWRKLRRNIRKAKRKKDELGSSSPLHTRKLRRRFSPIGVRNFSLYARHAADAFGASEIRRQIRRLERKADQEIRALKETPKAKAEE